MNGEQLVAMVKHFWPRMSRKNAIETLWSHTAFPFTKDGRHYRGALRRLKRTLRDGKVPCDCCNAPSLPGKWLCRECFRVLHAPESAVPGVPPTREDSE